MLILLTRINMDNSNEDKNKKTHKCDSCEKTFSYPRDLKRHTNSVHKGQKANKCDSRGNFFLKQVI